MENSVARKPVLVFHVGVQNLLDEDAKAYVEATKQELSTVELNSDYHVIFIPRSDINYFDVQILGA